MRRVAMGSLLSSVASHSSASSGATIGALLILVLGGCSSATFNVATGSDAGTDTPSVADTTTDVAANDAPSDEADAAPSICDNQPGITKFCITLQTQGTHPDYNSSTGADTLGIDGKGIAYVYIYDQDPVANPGALPVAPPLAYPPSSSIGATASIDTDFPVTLTGTVATPGTYWLIADFQDNAVAPRGTGAAAPLPGDFVVTPSVQNKTQVYPTISAVVGTTAVQTLVLRPYRRVDLAVSPGPVLAAAKLNPTIHGDGPAIFGLYDGDIASVQLLSVASVPCMDMQLQSLTAPTSVTASFGAFVSGNHKALLAIFDYTATPFPGRGTLLTNLTLGSEPQVNVVDGAWVTATSLSLYNVNNAYSATSNPADPFTCTPTATPASDAGTP